jgi:hypothetical protein
MKQRVNIQIPLTVGNNKQPPARRPWIRLGPVLALTGYMGQLACQVVLASGFCLSHSSPVQAMEREEEFGKGKEPSESSGESSGASSGKFYQDDNHPLTQEFWRGKGPSQRLEAIWPHLKELRECMEREGYLTKKPEDFSQEDWGNYIKVFEECTRTRFQELFACPQCAVTPVKELEDVHYCREMFTGISLELISPGETEESK